MTNRRQFIQNGFAIVALPTLSVGGTTSPPGRGCGWSQVNPVDILGRSKGYRRSPHNPNIYYTHPKDVSRGLGA